MAILEKNLTTANSGRRSTVPHSVPRRKRILHDARLRGVGVAFDHHHVAVPLDGHAVVQDDPRNFFRTHSVFGPIRG